MIFSMGAGQLDLVSHSLIGLSLIFLPIILFRIFPKYSRDCLIILRKLSGDSCDSTITFAT